ncbi:MAG: extracellular solute-binding protein [Chloroflexi bacterium]|nr:extracellular solute-binding protein [Chloroflexota bacterium]
MKLLTLMGILVSGAMILGACAPAVAPTSEAETQEQGEEAQQPEVQAEAESVTIQFWHTYSIETETPFLQDVLIPEFEASHPNIKVEQVQVPYDEFRRKLLTAISGGTAPDLIRADIIWVPEFADMGALVALDEFMPDFSTYQDAVFPGALATNFLNDHYYGLPLDTNTRVLVYNNDMFTAAGVQGPPTTMEEFLTACEQIKALGEGKYCFADGGTYAWAVNPWIWSFGGDVTDPDITMASGFLDGPNTQAAYEFLKNLVDQGYMHPGILGGGVDAWGGFGNDEIAMILEGPWFPPIFAGMFPDKDYGLALMPAGEGGPVSVVGGEDIVMFQQSQNKEASAEFIRFMLSEDVQLRWSEVGQLTVLASAIESDTIQNHPFFGIFLEQLKTAKARTPHPAWTKIEETYNLAGGSYLAGSASFEEALGGAAITIDGLLGQ